MMMHLHHSVKLSHCIEVNAYEEQVHHLADMRLSIDLDDGVKVNYAKFADILARMK